ncbi:MAG: hypothetical protein DRJ01_08840 [Bacteroidetes bacterium]|nr:MAG: hypothetical protein DRJ01_08840 [Bacteroidota bacterium]
MEIVAKTNQGVLISATENEVKQILNAVMGADEKRTVGIGQKLPAIDYAATILKIKSLHKDYDFKQLISYTKIFVKTVEKLNSTVEAAKAVNL